MAILNQKTRVRAKRNLTLMEFKKKKKKKEGGRIYLMGLPSHVCKHCSHQVEAGRPGLAWAPVHMCREWAESIQN